MSQSLKKKKDPNPKHLPEDLEYSSVSHTPQKISENDQVSFLNQQWPINSEELNKCLLEEYSETFDSKPEPPLTRTASLGANQTNFRALFNKLKSNSAIIRESGLDDLQKCLRNSEINPECLPLVDFPRLFKQDHPKCFQKVIACYQQLVKHSEPSLELMHLAIEQGFQRNKPTCVNKLLQYLFTNHASKLQDCILKGLSNSNTKIVQSFLMSLKSLVGTFGARNLSYLKIFMPSLKRIIIGDDSLQKISALNLIKQCIILQGPDCMFSQLQDLPGSVLDELSNCQIVETSKLQSNEKSMHSRSQTVEQPLKKYTQQWVESVLNAEKWTDKVKNLEQLLATLKDCKIISGQYRHISNLVKKMLPSNNMNVSTLLLKISGCMSVLVNRNFISDAKEMLPLILVKYRDKKHQMMIEVNSCLEQFATILSVQDMLPIIQSALKDKNSNMKIQVLHFIQNAIEKELAQSLAPKLEDSLDKLFKETFPQLLKDNSIEVRDEAVGFLRNIAQFVPVNKFPILKEFKNILSEQLPKRTSVKSRTSLERRDSSTGADVGAQITKALSKFSDLNSSLDRRRQGIIQLSNLIQQNTAITLSKVSHLSQLCNTLKNRLIESPKLLLKPLIVCIGILYEKVGIHLKTSSKQMIQVLVDTLKTDSVRTELLETLGKVESTIGLDSMVSTLISSLESDRPQRPGVLEFLNAQVKQLKAAQINQLYKGILNCLCDKTKEVRHFCIKLIEGLGGRFDISKLRYFVQKLRPNSIKQLESILAQFDPNKKASSRNSRTIIDNTNRFSLSQNSLVGSEINFEPQPIVHSQPVFADRSPRIPVFQEDQWLCHRITSEQQTKLRNNVTKLFDSQLAEKMFVIEYNTLMKVGNQIVQIVRSQQKKQWTISSSTTIFKWVLLRLWGGCSSASFLLQIVSELLKCLQKYSVSLKDRDIVILIAIVRQYVLSVEYQEVPSSLNTVIKSLISQRTGQKVLGELLIEYQKDITKLHQHIGPIRSKEYKNQLFTLMKQTLIDFMGDQLILAQISQMQKFSKDPEIVAYLYDNYGEESLRGYGFERVHKAPIISISFPKESQLRLTEEIDREKLRLGIQEPVPVEQCPKITQRIEEQESQLYQLADKQQQIVESKIVAALSQINPKDNQQVPSCKSFDQQFSKLSRIPAQQKFKNLQVLTKNYSEPQRYTHSYERSHHRRITQSLQISLNSFNPSVMSSFGQYLQRLVDGDLGAIQYFQKLLQKPTLRTSMELCSSADILLANFIKLCLYMIEIRYDVHPTVLLRCFNLLLEAIQCKYIIQNTQRTLPYLSEFVLHQVIDEDQQRMAIWKQIAQKYGSQAYKDDIFVVAVNKIMLRILENYPSLLLLTTFLNLTAKYTKSEGSLKLFTVLRKCIRRVCEKFLKQFKIDNFKEFIEIANKYCQEMQDHITPEDQTFAVLKSTLKSLEDTHGQVITKEQHELEITKNYFISLCELSTEKKLRLPKLDIKSPRLNKDLSSRRSGLQLSTQARKRLQLFKQTYPDFDLQKYTPKIQSKGDLALLSSVKTSQTDVKVLNKDIFDQIKEEICECFGQDLEKNITSVTIAGRAAHMKEGLKAIRTRMDELKSKIKKIEYSSE